MKPLGYQTEKRYVPMSMMVIPQGHSRFDKKDSDQITAAVKNSGAFSFLDIGLPGKGYCLVITQPAGKRANALVALNALTLLTLPIPYSYEQHLTGQVYKDGQLLKAFKYKRDGTTVAAWYVPPPYTENQRQMLTQLMRDLEASKLIPYTIDEAAK